MRVDTYTKIVLTVIAVCLATIAAGDVELVAPAFAQESGGKTTSFAGAGVYQVRIFSVARMPGLDDEPLPVSTGEPEPSSEDSAAATLPQPVKPSTRDAPLAPDLAAELEAMGEADQEYRKDTAGLFGDSPETRKRWAAQLKVDRENMERLTAIIEEHGWPGIRLVGERAATAAFLILQHAELEHQKKYLPLLRQARDAEDARPQDVAMLEDRVRMREGRPQLYGTQVVIDPTTGKRDVHPIEDESRVDERRAEVGLGPLAEYLAQLGVRYEPPAD